MFLTVQNPHGEVISLALTDLPVWSLELRATRYHQAKPEPVPEGEEPPKNEPQTLALGIVFVTGGATVFQPLAAIDLGSAKGEVGTIAGEGLGKGSAAANKESLRDRLGMLHNGASESASKVDDLIAKASVLADIHAQIVRSLWGTQSTLDSSAAALVKGEFEGWKYAITRTRFECVFVPGVAMADGMGLVPGLVPGDRPAPPTERPSSRRKPPVTKETAAAPGSNDPEDTKLPPAPGG